MRAARFHSKGDIRVEEVPEPKAGHGRVLVDVEWCGICGSDVHEYLVGPLTLPKNPHPISGECVPLAIGHELCGRVRDPPPGSRLTQGQPVMVDPRILCGSCLACKAGSGHCCSQLGYIGGTTGGGFGETVAVQEHMLRPLGDIPLEYAAVIEPLAVVVHAIKEAPVENWAEQSILVLGGGPIGYAQVIALRAYGARKIIVSEPARARREQLAEYTQALIDPAKEKVGDRCRELTEGRGVDVVFDCAGVPVGLQAGFDAVRFEGLYMNVAVWEEPLTLPGWKFLAKHITVKGVLIFSTEDFSEVMEMIVKGKLPGYERMVTGRIGLDDIVEKGFEELVNNKDKHVKILVSPRETD